MTRAPFSALLGRVVLLAAVAVPPAAHLLPVVAALPGGGRAIWSKGEAPALLTLPRAGEGWTQLAVRVAGSRSAVAGLKAANPRIASPLRGIAVRVPWELLRDELKAKVIRALFPRDRRTKDGWEHEIAAPWGGEGESWWEIAEWWCGDGSRYPALREANPELELFPPKGTRILIPAALLTPALRRFPPEAAREVLTPASPEPSPAAPPVPTATAAPAPPTTPEPAPTVTSRPAEATPAVIPATTRTPLEYADGVAIYRLRPGEALYSAVVVRFTGQLHASDVNATAAEIAKRSAVADVTSIPIGYPIRIPFDLLLPEFLPPNNPRRVAWEKDRAELAAIKRVIRAANLDRIHIILDAGHGGADSGATSEDVWESTYVYDVMARLKRVLEEQTRATVWTTVRDVGAGPLTDRDRLPITREQRLLVDPPYDLGDPPTGVNLRWVLSNAILARLEKQKVSPERVAFVSIHADSLHPSVRGLMVYVPSRALRPAHGPDPSRYWACREARETSAPRFSAAFRARAEALSTQLGEAIVRSAEHASLPVHPFEPVRSSVLRGGSRWVPAVLRYTRVPTAVLVEICNLNNEEDRSLLVTWKYREKLAHAIAAGLAEAFSR